MLLLIVKPGRKRVQVLMKKGGQPLLDYMKKMIDDSNLIDKPQSELDATIDYLQAYRLVDHKKIDTYARAFVVEDDNKTGVLKYEVRAYFLQDDCRSTRYAPYSKV